MFSPLATLILFWYPFFLFSEIVTFFDKAEMERIKENIAMTIAYAYNRSALIFLYNISFNIERKEEIQVWRLGLLEAAEWHSVQVDLSNSSRTIHFLAKFTLNHTSTIKLCAAKIITRDTDDCWMDEQLECSDYELVRTDINEGW